MGTAEEHQGIVIKLPVWARVIAIVGFPSFMAALLLLALLGLIPSPMTQMLGILTQLTQILGTHDQQSRDQRMENQRKTEYQNMLLRTICRGIVPAANQNQCEPKYVGYEEK